MASSILLAAYLLDGSGGHAHMTGFRKLEVGTA